MLFPRIITALQKLSVPHDKLKTLEKFVIPKNIIPLLESLDWEDIPIRGTPKPTIQEPYRIRKVQHAPHLFSTFLKDSFLHTLYQAFPLSRYVLEIPVQTTATIHLQIPAFCHLIIKTKQSHLTIIEENTPSTTMGISGLEMFVKDSTVHYIQKQVLIHQQLQFRHAHLDHSSCTWEPHLIHNDKTLNAIYSHLIHASSTIQGTYLGQKSEHISMDYSLHHAIGKSDSRITVQGAQYDKSHSQFIGTVSIDKIAAQSSTNVQEHCILVSPQATHETLPILEITTKEAEAFHSASINPIDREELFYLASRGINELEAKKLVVQSFLESIYSSSPIADQLRQLYLSNI